MSELQWKKRDFLTGAISFNSHDYVSNSDLWIKDVSFSVQKNGWELYDNVELLGDFKVIAVSKRGKLRSSCITTVDGLGDIVVSQVYADRKSEYILNPYDSHKILRA